MIPVCAPYLSGREKEYLIDCLESNWISSKGRYIDEFEERFARFCNKKYGIAVSSGTAALHVALEALGIGKGDEVIIPVFTMIATAFAVVYTGAVPVLVDSEPDTWNIDVKKIEEAITERTKAIVPVHIYGHPCEMDEIMRIAKRHNLLVVEDAAEAHGAIYKGKKAGSFGDINCFSFYANKIITTGEGGMVVTDDIRLAERARSIRNLSHSEKRFLHREIGYNYRMTNMQAAVGCAQLEYINDLIDLRRKNANCYIRELSNVPGIILPVERQEAKNVYWMFSIRIDHKKTGIDRSEFRAQLFERSVETRDFFVPVNKQPVFSERFKARSYPVAETISRDGLYLPSGSGLKEDELLYICITIKEIFNRKKS